MANAVEALDVVHAGMLLKKIAAESQLLRAAQLARPTDARDGWESRAIADLRSHISQLTLIIAKKAMAGLNDLEPKKGRSRGLNPQVLRAWETYREANASVFERAAQLASRIEAARSRGLAPAMVIYGAIRGLKGEG